MAGLFGFLPYPQGRGFQGPEGSLHPVSGLIGAGQLDSQGGRVCSGVRGGIRFAAVLGETCGIKWGSGPTWRPSPL